MKIAILGATSQIAKNLIFYFLKNPQYKLFLFARNKKAVYDFIMTNDSLSFPLVLGLDEFLSGEYDAVINCIGIGDPSKLRAAGIELFRLTEYFDNLVIDYLSGHKNVTYINFSSGAVYGTAFDSGVTEDSMANIAVNKIAPTDFYRIAKLNSEAKHRALADRNIIDLRIFSFFSQFIDLDSGFLLCEMMRCTKTHSIFHTNKVDIVRDFIAPSDLYSLVELCLCQKRINCALDVNSAKPVLKSELLHLFSREFGLVVEVDDKIYSSTTGTKLAYYSNITIAFCGLTYIPAYKSIDTIEREAGILFVRGIK